MGILAKAAGFVKRDFLAILPVTIFFLIGLNLIAISKHLVLAERGIVYEGTITATFGALLIAKIVLVVNKLPIMRFYRGCPLYQTILYRAVVYSMCVLAFRLLEMLIGHWIKEGDLSAGLDSAHAAFIWHHMTFLQLWTLILFLVYLTVVELLDAYGEGSLKKVFFTRPPSSHA